METIMDYFECLNTHWLAMVSAGMYTHIREICIIGLCFEDSHGPVFHPTFASLLFTFSVLSVLAEYKPWPRSLKEPPLALLYIYEMLIAALVANLATRAVWVPLLTVLWNLTQTSSKWLMWMNTETGLDQYQATKDFASYMGNENSTFFMAWCISFMSFLWMMDATESLDAILDYFSTKMIVNLSVLMKKLLYGEVDFVGVSRLVINWMVKVLCTIWALMLNTAKIYIFQPCCENTTEKDEETITFGPPLPAFFFATGVYIILAKVSLFPRSFQKPIAPILCAYELLSTLFILEFTVTCIWAPVNVLILSTLPNAISHILNEFNEHEAADWIDDNYHMPVMVMIFILSIGFLLVSLHIAKALDFSILTDYGVVAFLECAVCRLWQRLLNELPKAEKTLYDCSTVNDRKKRVKKPRKRKVPFKECHCSSTDS